MHGDTIENGSLAHGAPASAGLQNQGTMPSAEEKTQYQLFTYVHHGHHDPRMRMIGTAWLGLHLSSYTGLRPQ
jgi:hypothetical protein